MKLGPPYFDPESHPKANLPCCRNGRSVDRSGSSNQVCYATSTKPDPCSTPQFHWQMQPPLDLQSRESPPRIGPPVRSMQNHWWIQDSNQSLKTFREKNFFLRIPKKCLKISSTPEKWHVRHRLHVDVRIPDRP